jgi:hypothetical protein
MKIAAVRSNLPERKRVVFGPLDMEANTGSIRREAGRVRQARYREQLLRIGSIGVRLVYVGGLAKDEVAAVR